VPLGLITEQASFFSAGSIDFSLDLSKRKRGEGLLEEIEGKEFFGMLRPDHIRSSIR
jgi:hypothetical protein